MGRRAAPEQQTAGNDSFLDVITNIVGILIILVMVVGERARHVPDVTPPPPSKPDGELTQLIEQEAAIDGEVRKLADELAMVNVELAGRAAERNRLSTLITAIDNELAQRRAKLDEKSQRQFDLNRELALAQAELDSLEKDRQAAEKAAEPETIKVESYPTPLSRTVDDRELHFQLLGGRLTYVPFEALVDRLKATLREYASRLQDEGELTDTIGPIGGFRLRYTLERQDTPRGTLIQVAYLEFIPTSSTLGEPMSEALAVKSQLRDKLEMISPRQYTITVWTYPDSFAEYRELKKELYRLGYSVAARPLPLGLPIGASPQGSKSSAQ